MAVEIQTLENVKAWLKIDAGDTEFDALLTQIKDTVEEAIYDYIDTAFEITAVTDEIHDGNRGDVILPVNFPLVAVTKIAVNLNPDGTGGAVYTGPDVAKMAVIRDEAIALKGIHPSRLRGSVAIDYTYGYDGVPNRAKMAVNLSVEAFWNRRSRGSVGINSRSKEGESESYGGGGDKNPWNSFTGLPREAMALLEEYRRIEFADSTLAERHV